MISANFSLNYIYTNTRPYALGDYTTINKNLRNKIGFIFLMKDNMQEYDLTSDNGVKKIILKQGIQNRKFLNDSVVTIHYTGFLENGDVFDSSYKRKEPYSFELFKGNVIQGWDIGIQSMNLYEKAKFTIMPQYGYKKKGIPPTIPPNAKLFFEIELLNVKTPDNSDKKSYKMEPIKDTSGGFFFISPFRSQSGKDSFQWNFVLSVFFIIFCTFWIIINTGSIHSGYLL